MRTLRRAGLLIGLVALVLTIAHPAPAVLRAELPVGDRVVPGSADDDAKTRRFWVKDKHFYRSPWYAGRHRKMIAFGCTKAPYYPPSTRCDDEQGFHHGLDIAMGCGTRLFAGLRGRVVQPDSAGSLGDAYGPYAFRLRNHRFGRDFVIGHVLRVYVEPGDRVRHGDLIARASDQGAPDGCHLHFEARPERGSYTTAVNPTRYLHLKRAGRAG